MATCSVEVIRHGADEHGRGRRISVFQLRWEWASPAQLPNPNPARLLQFVLERLCHVAPSPRSVVYPAGTRRSGSAGVLSDRAGYHVAHVIHGAEAKPTILSPQPFTATSDWGEIARRLLRNHKFSAEGHADVVPSSAPSAFNHCATARPARPEPLQRRAAASLAPPAHLFD